MAGLPPHVQLRQGHSGDAAALSELALRSKGYWGYDAAFLEACRRELTLEPSDVESRRVTVAVDRSDRPVGFYTLDGEPPEGELGMMFVDPDRIGTGVGRRLWEHMAARAAALGFRTVHIEADPGAATFYEKMGATVVGSVPSGSIPGRRLPLLVFDSRPPLRVRAANPADARAAAEIYVVSSNAAFADFQPPMELNEQRAAQWETDLARRDCHWWLAEIADEPVGLAGVGPSRDPVEAGVGELDTIAVIPEYWRRGIGRALMAVANEQLDRDGFDRAVLWTWVGYPAAAAFYPKVGWRLTARRRDRGRQICYERARTRR